jgi:O2-independent ubiquinone biosynthesis protein UbiU
MSPPPQAIAAPPPCPVPAGPPARLQLTVAAATLDDVRLAVAAGADWVNFTQRSLSYDRRLREVSPWMRECEQVIAIARHAGRRIAIAFAARYGTQELPRVARAAVALADAGVDALIASDLGTLDLIRGERPELALHVSPQASATNREAVCLYASQFGASRVAIPTTLPPERLRHLVESSPAELELFGHGSHAAMLEGQCALSSWITGASVGRDGACSPAHMIHEHRTWRTVVSRLNGVLIDVRPLGAHGSLTAACRGRFRVSRGTAYLFGTHSPVSLLDILPSLVSPRALAFRVVPTPGEPGRRRALLRAWREAIAQAADLLPCSASTTGHL